MTNPLTQAATRLNRAPIAPLTAAPNLSSAQPNIAEPAGEGYHTDTVGNFNADSDRPKVTDRQIQIVGWSFAGVAPK